MNVDSIEIIKDRLYFASIAENGKPPTSSQTRICFSTDATLIYTAFFADFGPLDLGLTYSFCTQLKGLMDSAQVAGQSVLYYSSSHPHRRADSAVLLCAYLIFVLDYSVEQAYGPFFGINPPFTNFRDAAFAINTFPVSVLDCAKAMRRAVSVGHFSYTKFSLESFTHLQRLENGDVSWIVPDKFIAFSGPLTVRRQIAPGKYTLSPEDYVPLFRSLGVTCVVRFNSKCYNRQVFLNAGIRHVDLFYEDGGNPTEDILQSFLRLCDRESGAVAVHCKAGLGRTGTNIAAYMMKHYAYSAKEAIAWCRICRPGSVVGLQQQYLASIESRMWKEGESSRDKAANSKELRRRSFSRNQAAPVNTLDGLETRGAGASTRLREVDTLNSHALQMCSHKSGEKLKPVAQGQHTPHGFAGSTGNLKDSLAEGLALLKGQAAHGQRPHTSAGYNSGASSSKFTGRERERERDGVRDTGKAFQSHTEKKLAFTSQVYGIGVKASAENVAAIAGREGVAGAGLQRPGAGSISSILAGNKDTSLFSRAAFPAEKGIAGVVASENELAGRIQRGLHNPAPRASSNTRASAGSGVMYNYSETALAPLVSTGAGPSRPRSSSTNRRTSQAAATLYR